MDQEIAEKYKSIAVSIAKMHPDESAINNGILIKNLGSKSEQTYIFVYKDDQEARVIKVLGECAHRNDLSFDFHDAAILSQSIRAKSKARKQAEKDFPGFEFE